MPVQPEHEHKAGDVGQRRHQDEAQVNHVDGAEPEPGPGRQPHHGGHLRVGGGDGGDPRDRHGDGDACR